LGIVDRFLKISVNDCCFKNLLLESSKVENLNGNRKKKTPPITFSNHAIDQNLKVIMFRIFG
jgi:plastocyanin domain-containing protein